MRVIQFSCKCSDMSGTRFTIDGHEVFNTDGYVPSFLPFGDGDYVVFTVDLDTGQILNWNIPTQESIEAFIEELNS